MSKPARIQVGDDIFIVTILRVESRYEDGAPEILRLLKDDSTAELSEDPTKNHFLIGYLSEMDHSKFQGQIPTI